MGAVTFAVVNERVWELDRLLFVLLLRLLVWLAVVVIVGDAVLDLWERGSRILAVLAGIFFPVTVLVWPWLHDAFGYPLWLAIVAAIAAQSLSFTATAGERVGAAWR
jgi:hypothetical protein